jgi:Transposase IS66 family
MPSGWFIRNVNTGRRSGQAALNKPMTARRSRHRNDRSRSRNRRSRCRNHRSRSSEIPSSTLARTSGNAGAALVPLYEVHKRFVLSCHVLHADETTVSMLDPGAGKTKRSYIAESLLPGGRGAQVVANGTVSARVR